MSQNFEAAQGSISTLDESAKSPNFTKSWEEPTQPNNTPDSQHSVTSSEVTPSAGQGVNVVDDTLPNPSSPTPSPLELLVATAVTDQARTLGVLASRVEALETQLAQLQQERDNFGSFAVGIFRQRFGVRSGLPQTLAPQTLPCSATRSRT